MNTVFKLSYPRHVKKAIDLFKILKGKINLLIWVVDAREPILTFKYLPTFLEQVNYKKNIVVFANKIDIAQDFNLKSFKQTIKDLFLKDLSSKDLFSENVMPVLAGSHKNCKNLYNYLENLVSKELFLNGIVVGLPNVGKSSLINCLANKKKTQVSEIPGTTKKLNWISIKYNIKILDCPGIVLPLQITKEELLKLIELKILNYSFVNVKKDKLEALLNKNGNSM